MPFLGRALYNLLFLEGKQDHPDFAVFSNKELFTRLEEFSFFLNEDTFIDLAKDRESPEEMYATLKAKKEEMPEMYLILFELWKRLIHDKKTISIFCDELDLMIHNYDLRRGENEEKLQEKIFLLQDILDAGVDAKQNPHEIFQLVSDYLAHDLESFIYDYIFELIEKDKDTLASELLDGFYPYIKELLWFDYLRLCLLFKNPGEELSRFFANFIESLMANPDPELLIEVLLLIQKQDCGQFFLTLFRFVVAKITNYGQLYELLDIAANFYKISLNQQKVKKCEEAKKQIKKEIFDQPLESSHPAYLVLLQV